MILLEVMDKEPSVAGMWFGAAVWGLGGFLLCRRWWWIALAIVPLMLLAAAGLAAEIGDPYVGPAILQEAGPTYPAHAYVTAALMIVLPAGGAAMCLWRRRLATHSLG